MKKIKFENEKRKTLIFEPRSLFVFIVLALIFKDYISPDSFEFKSDHFKVGYRYARVLFLRDCPSFIKDMIIRELTDASRNMIFNFDIIPVSTEDAQRFGEKQALGIETNIDATRS